MKPADNWNAELYDTKHKFVSEYGNSLIGLLSPQPSENILDLGCGTGDLSYKIGESGAHIVGIDQSENMIRQASSKYPDIAFDVQNAAKLPYTNQFDAVFSNAVLHWIKEPGAALEGVFRSLKQGGRFVAEFGGKGNVELITSSLIQQITETGFEFSPEQFPWYYPSIGEYTALMEKSGFYVTFAMHFDRPTPLEGEDGLKNWIRMFCTQLLEGIPEQETEMIIANTEKQLKGSLWKNGHWIADYKRIRVIGIKPSALTWGGKMSKYHESQKPEDQ